MNWNWLCDQTSRVLRTLGEAVDEVKDTTQDVVEIWKRIRLALDRALMPHPEARVAVMRALEEEFVPARTG